MNTGNIPTENSLSQFTNLYSLSKTLRFELKPVGKTEEWILKNNIIGVAKDPITGSEIEVGKDAERAKHYKYAKRMIDEMHRVFIEEALNDVHSTGIDLILNELAKDFDGDVALTANHRRDFKTIMDTAANRWVESYSQEMPQYWRQDIAEIENKLETENDNQKKKNLKSAIKAIQKKIDNPNGVIKKRKIEVMFSNEDTIRLLEWKIRSKAVQLTFKELEQSNSEEFIPVEILTGFLREFDRFASYFSGFNENRANVYDVKGDKPTSIINRIFNENYVHHLSNLEKWKTFMKSLEKYKDEFEKKNFEWKELQKEIEIELNATFETFFSISTFSNALNQSGIDAYNRILGGDPALNGGTKIRGVNEFINACRQQAGGKRNEFPAMKVLYKQILSKSDKTFIAEFKDDQEMFQAIHDFHFRFFVQKAENNQTFLESTLTTTRQLIPELEQDLENIYVTKEQTNSISQALTGHWSNLNQELLDTLGESTFGKRKLFSFKEIEDVLSNGARNKHFDIETKYAGGNTLLLNYFSNQFETLIFDSEEAWNQLENNGVLLSTKIDASRTNPEEKGFEQIAAIKGFLDAAITLSGFMRDWQFPNKSKQPKGLNLSWYDHLKLFGDEFQILGLYNMVRNHVSKKETVSEKIKITFDKPKLLDGFVDSHSKSDNATQFNAYIFRRLNEKFDEYEFFLGISKNPQLFRCHLKNEIKKDDFSEFERLEYYQSKSTTFFSSEYSKHKERLIELLSRLVLVKTGSICTIDYTKGKNLEKKVLKTNSTTPLTAPALIKAISKEKELRTILEDNDVMVMANAMIKNMQQYASNFTEKNPLLKKVIGRPLTGTSGLIEIIEEFQSIATKSKKYSYFNVSKQELLNALNDPKRTLYLFRISNKDLNFIEQATRGKRKAENRGKDNLHTLYFKALMSGNQSVFDLGKGEIFFRKASYKIPEEKKAKGYHVKILQENYDYKYPIFKNKRFTSHKYFFNLSTFWNYTAPTSNNTSFNQRILDFLKNNPDVNVIGVDRGEKHLLYYTVTNQKGEIIDQGSLNQISNGFIPRGETKERSIDYQKKLDEVEKKRDQARKSWSMIENIKELKAGYLSQVVHQLAILIIKHNAIVVLEDLNQGFKRGRFRVEKQVYQKFEKALIDKLNYLVFKDIPDPKTPGHYLKAYQLTNECKSFKELGKQKQSGILFYTAASYTSTTDPVSGFLKNVYTRYASVEKSLDLWRSMDSIIYNPSADRFEFTYTIGKVSSKNMNAEKGEKSVSKRTWTVCSCVTRSRYEKPDRKQSEEQKQNTSSEQIGNKGVHITFWVTDKIKETLEAAGIDYRSNTNIQEQLLARKDSADKSLHKSMVNQFNSILSIRVTDDSKKGIPNEHDFIMSPVEPFFDSRKTKTAFPSNGDANGAYNIARKGLCILNRLNKPSTDLFIDKLAWQEYVQDEKIVEQQTKKWGLDKE